MHMRIDQSGHQGCAGKVDLADVFARRRGDRRVGGLPDPIAFHQHVEAFP